MAAKGEIEVNESKCLGCGYCAHFCDRGCIEITGDRYTTKGYLLPTFVSPEKCTGCALCSWMCPQFAIDVYKYVDASPRTK